MERGFSIQILCCPRGASWPAWGEHSTLMARFQSPILHAMLKAYIKAVCARYRPLAVHQTAIIAHARLDPRSPSQRFSYATG